MEKNKEKVVKKVVNLVYNPECDINDVDQFGFVDLCDVYSKGVISGDFNITDDAYNRIPPDCVMKRPSDMFEALRQRGYVNETLKAAKASAEAAAAAAVAE